METEDIGNFWRQPDASETRTRREATNECHLERKLTHEIVLVVELKGKSMVRKAKVVLVYIWELLRGRGG